MVCFFAPATKQNLRNAMQRIKTFKLNSYFLNFAYERNGSKNLDLSKSANLLKTAVKNNQYNLSQLLDFLNSERRRNFDLSFLTGSSYDNFCLKI